MGSWRWRAGRFAWAEEDLEVDTFVSSGDRQRTEDASGHRFGGVVRQYPGSIGAGTNADGGGNISARACWERDWFIDNQTWQMGAQYFGNPVTLT